MKNLPFTKAPSPRARVPSAALAKKILFRRRIVRSITTAVSAGLWSFVLTCVTLGMLCGKLVIGH